MAQTMITLADLRQARARLKHVAVHTPLVRYWGPETGGEEFYLKAESLQPIGSFKLRGAYNKIASLTAAERARGVITYSSGNHAQGVAYAARVLGASAVIVMPASAPRIKIDATLALGAEIVPVGDGSEERRDKALELAEAHGYVVIPPYDDLQIIAGQGTAGLEIWKICRRGTGAGPYRRRGLSSGVATAIKLSGSQAKVVGVEPALANDAQQSLRQGYVVRISAESAACTIADGLRTQSIGAHNFRASYKSSGWRWSP